MNLTKFNLGGNQLTGNIPAELGNLVNLDYIYLWGNQLTGNIPATLGNLTNLRILDMPHNQLTGNIPSELGNLANLEEIFLQNNQLSGPIPVSLGNLTNLQELNLNTNQLTDTIPTELGNLSNLKRFDLYTNNFTGALPQNLTNLNLDRFHFYETYLCEPSDSAFQTWLTGIGDMQSTGTLCSVTVPASGGTVTPSSGVTITIKSSTFTDTVIIRYLPQPPNSTGTLNNIGLFYDLSMVYSSTGQTAQLPFGGSYTITVTYALTSTNEANLALYFFGNGQWVKEETSQVDVDANTVTANPSHFSLWAVLEAAAQNKIYLPLVLK